MRNDLVEINVNLKEYYKLGLQRDFEAAVRHAQCATRAFVERLHPDTGFDGKSLKKATTVTGQTDNLIQKGTFLVYGYKADANIYANYFARWYNLGVYFRPLRYGPNKGKLPTDAQRQMRYPRPIIAKNRVAIQEHFKQALDEFMAKRIQEKLRKGGTSN